MQTLYDSSKGPTSEIYPMAKDGQTLVKVAYRFGMFNEGTISFDNGRQLNEMARGDEM